MKKIIIALIVLAVVGFATYYFVFRNSSVQTSESSEYGMPMQNSQTTTPPPVSSTNPSPTTPVSSVVTVSIKNFAFNPSMVTVKAGTKVTWVNNDSAPHTVTSDSGNLLNSGTLLPGQSFSFTFNTAGTVSYHCNIHPMMKAAVVVE